MRKLHRGNMQAFYGRLMVTIFVLAALKPSLGLARDTIQVETGDPACELEFLVTSTTAKLTDYHFSTPRDYLYYARSFGAKFSSRLADLRARGGSWVDYGAGEARAQLQFLQRLGRRSLFNRWFSPGVQTVAIALKFPEDAAPEFVAALDLFERSGQMNYLQKRRFEDIPDSELGIFDLATDFFGPLTYTLDLSGTLNKYLRHMFGGQRSDLFFSISETDTEATIIQTRDGTQMHLTQWLSQQPGLVIEQTHRSSNDIENTYHLAITGDAAVVPALRLREIQRNQKGLIVHRLFVEL